MADSIFGGTIDLLGKSLDIRSKRHSIIASNIANAETPGYKAKDISFEDELKKAIVMESGDMRKTNPRHMSGAGNISSVTVKSVDAEGALRNDGNNVSVDEEMSKLAQNSIGYDTASQILAKKFGTLKYAISEGRR